MYSSFIKIRILILTLSFLLSSVFAQKNILVISIPKTGCHLLTKCISLLTSKQEIFAYSRLTDKNILECLKKAGNLYSKDQGTFVLGHIEYSDRCQELLLNQNQTIFFILRDPRDQVISHAHFLLKERFADEESLLARLNFNLDNVILSLIQSGDLYVWFSGVHDIKSLYQLYLPWKYCPQVYTTYFEKLVGSKGGGNDEEQFKEIKNIAKHLGLDMSDEKIKDIASKLFGDDSFDWPKDPQSDFLIGEKTFRSGQIGSWKTCFNEQHKKAFNSVAGDLLIELGYEDYLSAN